MHIFIYVYIYIYAYMFFPVCFVCFSNNNHKFMILVFFRLACNADSGAAVMLSAPRSAFLAYFHTEVSIAIVILLHHPKTVF